MTVLSRSFPVDSERGERHLALNQPFVDHAAMAPEEPEVQYFRNAANVGFQASIPDYSSVGE